MPRFELVKTTKGELRGLTQADQERYERHLKRIANMEPGEYFAETVVFPRNPKFHRKFFAMLKLGFEHWDPAFGRKRLMYKGVPIEKDFEQFREDVTIQAGFFEAYYDSRNRAHLKAKSIAWDKMEEEDFERLYRAVQQILLERVLGKTYDKEKLDEAVEQIQRFGANNG